MRAPEADIIPAQFSTLPHPQAQDIKAVSNGFNAAGNFKERRVSMKRFFAILGCCAICAVISASVFISEGTTEGDFGIYATESEINTVVSKMSGTNAVSAMNEFHIAIDESTVMPLYHASLLNYAATGEFEFEPFQLDGEQVYVSDAVDAEGNFAGVIEFNANDIHIYMPTADEHESVDFISNLRRINILTAESAVPIPTDAKLMFVEGLGYAYYMNDGEDAILVAAEWKGTNEDIFTQENGGIIAIDDELMRYAEELVAVKSANEQYLATLASGENP